MSPQLPFCLWFGPLTVPSLSLLTAFPSYALLPSEQELSASVYPCSSTRPRLRGGSHYTHT